MAERDQPRATVYTFQDNVGTCLQREVYVHISLPGAKKELLAGETKKGRGLEKKRLPRQSIAISLARTSLSRDAMSLDTDAWETTEEVTPAVWFARGTRWVLCSLIC